MEFKQLLKVKEQSTLPRVSSWIYLLKRITHKPCYLFNSVMATIIMICWIDTLRGYRSIRCYQLPRLYWNTRNRCSAWTSPRTLPKSLKMCILTQKTCLSRPKPWTDLELPSLYPNVEASASASVAKSPSLPSGSYFQLLKVF